MSKTYERLINDEILKEETFKEDYDNLLDLREEEDFDIKWIEVFNILKEKNLENPIDINILDEINKIREEAFKKVYKITKSSDLAAYVSDDFEIIAYAVALNFNIPWLNGVLAYYLKNRFPCGIIEDSNITLREQLYGE